MKTNPKEALHDQQNKKKQKDLSFVVEGMNCASCVSSVEKAISSVKGVESVSVNLATETASVKGNAAASEIAEAIRNSGYNTVLDTYELSVEGMNCASCVSSVEKAISSVEGVTSANVNLATEKATVTVLSNRVAPGRITDAVKKSGYNASLVSGKNR